MKKLILIAILLLCHTIVFADTPSGINNIASFADSMISIAKPIAMCGALIGFLTIGFRVMAGMENPSSLMVAFIPLILIATLVPMMKAVFNEDVTSQQIAKNNQSEKPKPKPKPVKNSEVVEVVHYDPTKPVKTLNKKTKSKDVLEKDTGTSPIVYILLGLVLFLSFAFLAKHLYKKRKSKLIAQTALDDKMKKERDAFLLDFPIFRTLNDSIDELIDYVLTNKKDKLAIKKVTALRKEKDNIIQNVFYIVRINNVNSASTDFNHMISTLDKNGKNIDIGTLSVEKLREIEKALNEFKKSDIFDSIKSIKSVDTVTYNKQTKALLKYTKVKQRLNDLVTTTEENSFITTQLSHRIKTLHESDLETLYTLYSQNVGKQKGVHTKFMKALEDVECFLNDAENGKNTDKALFEFQAQIRYLKNAI